MAKITIAQIAHFTKDKNGNALVSKTGKPYSRCLIDTTDGRKLSGFGSQQTSNWNQGMEVEVEITESNGYLNFSVPKKGSIDSQALEMALKTHIDRYFGAIQHDLKIIAQHLGVEEPKPTVGNTSVPYPTDEGYSNPSPFDNRSEEDTREAPLPDDHF